MKKQFPALLLAVAALFLFSQFAGPESEKKQFPEENEFDGCTSIIVGKAASVDGSTITSHSCDSRTDRTWINVVPHIKYEFPNECPVYLEPKRTKGPDDEDVIGVGASEPTEVDEPMKPIEIRIVRPDGTTEDWSKPND